MTIHELALIIAVTSKLTSLHRTCHLYPSIHESIRVYYLERTQLPNNIEQIEQQVLFLDKKNTVTTITHVKFSFGFYKTFSVERINQEDDAVNCGEIVLPHPPCCNMSHTYFIIYHTSEPHNIMIPYNCQSTS